MPQVVTINRPDVVALIEEAASQLTGGNKTEAIAIGMKRLLADAAYAKPLFGAHPRSVVVGEGVDLIAPVFNDALDAETGDETRR